MQERIDYKKLNFESAKEYLGGKNVVFTGRGFLVRGELMRLARQAGANVDSIVTKKCDILIVGEKPGSKLRKAKVLGCEIISTSDFKDILEGLKVPKLCNDDSKADIFNINLNAISNEGINIKNKNIAVIIGNDVLRERTIRNIKNKGGNIVSDIEKGKTNIVVYQPNSEIVESLERAKSLEIKVLTLGVFNKLLVEK